MENINPKFSVEERAAFAGSISRPRTDREVLAAAVEADLALGTPVSLPKPHFLGTNVTADVLSIIEAARVKPTRMERLRSRISSIRGK